MKFGVLGTGDVGQRLASKLAGLGNDIKMGSRTADNPKALNWAKENGAKCSAGKFSDAAAFGEIVFLCVKGDAVMDVIQAAGTVNFKGKTVVDVTNPLDFSKGMPPSLFVSNTNSMGEEVQKAIPDARVIKTLNCVSNEIMVNPELTGGEPTMFLSGNNLEAKEEIKKVLVQFGWKDLIDLGDITGARCTEMLLPIWLRLWGTLQNGQIGFKIVRKH